MALTLRSEISSVTNKSNITFIFKMFATVWSSNTSIAICFKIEIASPAAFFAFWPWPTPLSIHACHVFSTPHLSPVVFAICIASMSCWDNIHVITWRHHFIFECLWPVNWTYLCLIIIKSAHFRRNLLDSRISQLLIVVSLGRYPNFVSGKWFDFSPDCHFIEILTQRIEIGDFVTDLTVFYNVAVNFEVKMRNFFWIYILGLEFDLERLVLNIICWKTHEHFWWRI